MMTYEIFKEVVIKKFMDFLPEKYQNMKLRTETVNKINRVLDGLTLVNVDSSKNVSPTIYLNDMYEDYSHTENLNEVLQKAADMMDRAFEDAPAIVNLDFDNAHDNIVFQLINTEQNSEMLMDAPHREFLDLSIIYRWVVADDERGVQSSIIRNSLAKKLGMSEEELFKAAMANTMRIFPPEVKTMYDILKRYLISQGTPVEIIDDILEQVPIDLEMWVVTNNKNINGANGILYESVLNDLAMKIDSDLYILPSSVHECIVVPTTFGDLEMLSEMVPEVNMSHLSVEERLSNNVYYYDREARKLSLATNDSNKSLAYNE